jgi:hypothetical protein
MVIDCPRCGGRVAAEHVNVAHLVAKCLPCDDVFTFEPQMRPTSEDLARPPSITVSPEGIAEATTGTIYRNVAARGPLRLTYRTKRRSGLAVLAFSLVWSEPLVSWYTRVISEGAPTSELLFPIVHVAGGVFLFYTGIALLINSTVVSIDSSHLRVRHGPIPWPGNLDVKVYDLRQLFVRAHQSRKGDITYSVDADVAGIDVRLLGRIDQHEARFIERTLERHLAIVDDPGRN